MCLILNVYKLSGDLIQKNREFDQQNMEMKECKNRLRSYDEISLNQESKLNNSSVEMLKYRNELFSVQELRHTEELNKAKDSLNDCANALKISENSNSLLVQELHNVRAKLNQVEGDYESSRSHYGDLDRAR